MEFIVTYKKDTEYTVIIDKEDYERIKLRKWHACQKNKNKHSAYIVSERNKYDINLPKKILLHAFILGIYGKEIDHKNRNPLDNRKENLRLATHKQNCRNSTIARNNKSGFKGVHYREDANMFRVKIEVDGKQVYGGYYKYAVNAAKKYNKMAIEYFGEYANINIIPKKVKVPIEKEKEYIRRYIGVEPIRKKFRVSIYVNKGKINIGMFNKEVDAAKAWNKAVIKYNKPKRFLNIISNE